MAPYADAYLAFLAHFHGTRDYFECHELLEEHWKKEERPELKAVWHGLIQLAVALYHERRGNRPGALKMLESALARLSDAQTQLAGLDRSLLLEAVEERLAHLRLRADNGIFQDMNLPVTDQLLMRSAVRLCQAWGLEWGRPSPLTEVELVEKHRLRDRSEVIEQRLKQLSDKRNHQPRQTERERP